MNFATNEIGSFEVELGHMNLVLSTCFVCFYLFAEFACIKFMKHWDVKVCNRQNNNYAFCVLEVNTYLFRTIDSLISFVNDAE